MKMRTTLITILLLSAFAVRGQTFINDAYRYGGAGGNSLQQPDNIEGAYDWTTEAGSDGSTLGNKSDASGNGNTLIADGPTVHVATGDGVKEAGFDGANDEFRINSPTYQFSPSSSFSVALVIGEDLYGLNDAICGFASSGTVAEWGIKSVNTADRIRVAVGGTESAQLTLTGTSRVVVFVSNGTSTSVYINGSSTAATTFTNGSSTNTYDFTIGEWTNNTGDLTGSIRQLYIYSDQLSSGEIAAIMSEFYQP